MQSRTLLLSTHKLIIKLTEPWTLAESVEEHVGRSTNAVRWCFRVGLISDCIAKEEVKRTKARELQLFLAQRWEQSSDTAVHELLPMPAAITASPLVLRLAFLESDFGEAGFFGKLI